MKLRDILFRSLLASLFLVSASSSAFAGASNKNGNPFGNGTFFDNNGTFSGVLRGQNLTGVTQFSTFGSGTVTTVLNNNTPGVTAIYYNGTSYVGSSQSVVDPSAGVLSSVFALAGPVPTLGDPTGNTANNFGAFVNDALNLNGSFIANLQNSYPNQTFNGSGQVTINDASIGGTNSQQPAPGVNPGASVGPGSSASFTITGVRISSSALPYQ